MSTNPYCQLTTKDHTILETMLERCGDRDSKLAALLRQKLKAAAVVFRDDIPPKVVTLNSRVAYRIDDGPVRTQLIVQGEGSDFPHFALSIYTLHGLALLGLAERQSIVIERADGGDETIFVEQIVFQPESNFRGRERQMSNPISNIARLQFRRAPQSGSATAMAPDDDDPGPQAA